MQRKYLTIYDDLVKQIEANVWPTSTMLPSENKLTVHYQTSRETIRKALDLLSQNGYIQKIQGKGSVVIDTNRFAFPVSGIQSYTELTESLNLNSKTSVHNIGYVHTENEFTKMLKSNPTDSIWSVVRSREVDGENIILDKDYFNETYVPLLTKSICEHSIYEYIENTLGLVIGFAQKEIVVETPTEEDRTDRKSVV